MRLRLPAISCLLLAGAGAFACASPSLQEEDPGAPLPDRVPSVPKTDAALVDQSAAVDPPRDARPDQEAAPVDAFRLLHAFVSSATVNAALGGIAGADLKCNALAAAQGLKGTYRAWISVNGTNAAVRITSAGPWLLVTGQVVAVTHAQLTSGQLSRPLNIDEKGAAVSPADDRVWTGTAPDGTFSGPECGLWSGAGTGRVGEAEFSDSRWSSSTLETCNLLNRLYCFEL